MYPFKLSIALLKHSKIKEHKFSSAFFKVSIKTIILASFATFSDMILIADLAISLSTLLLLYSTN